MPNNINSTYSDYRPDIDGLRALAVLSVIIFHINESIIPGGFVGVDIFFVISGYLITRHIFRDLNANKFSLLEFYRRRVKRIMPAMLVVVLLTIVITQFIYLPRDAEKVAQSGLWSLLSLANAYFWLFEDTSYFAAASNEKPLLHLWSLGVEEQFYIFWPLILMFTYRLGHGKYFFSIFGFITIVSFLLGDYLFSYDPSFTYYMLPTRAGELLIGALLAQFILKRGEIKIPGFVVSLSSQIGVALIVISLFFFSKQDVFPGIRAIPPTLGAALLMFSGHYGSPISNRILKLQPVVWVGIISYSAYLWHWPVIAFYRYGYSDITLISGVVIFALSILLGWLSYRYIETPFRHSKRGAVQVFIRQFIIPSGCIAFIALLSMKIDGYGVRWFSEEYKASLLTLRDETRPAYHFDYVCQSQVITAQDINNNKCVLGEVSKGDPDVILWGDSNAAHYIGIIGAFAKKAGFSFRNIEIGDCPPIDADASSFAKAKRVSDCRKSREVSLDTVNNYKIVLISADWVYYQSRSDSFLNVFYETVQSIVDKGKKVIIIGKAPIINSYDRLCREKAISFPFVTCDMPSAPLDNQVAEVNNKLKDFATRNEDISYYDFNDYLCPNGSCSVRDKYGRVMYYDPEHLALEASWNIGDRIIKTDGVPFPFNAISKWLGNSR